MRPWPWVAWTWRVNTITSLSNIIMQIAYSEKKSRHSLSARLPRESTVLSPIYHNPSRSRMKIVIHWMLATILFFDHVQVKISRLSTRLKVEMVSVHVLNLPWVSLLRTYARILASMASQSVTDVSRERDQTWVELCCSKRLTWKSVVCQLCYRFYHPSSTSPFWILWPDWATWSHLELPI